MGSSILIVLSESIMNGLVSFPSHDRLVDFYPEVPESRRQDLFPAAYVRNGSIYATTLESFVKSRVRLGKDTRPFIMDSGTSG